MSDDPSKIKDIDLELFKEDKSECKKPSDTKLLITECCTYLKRLCAASRYFDVLFASKMDEEKKKEIFVEFMDTVYDSVIDDTAHLLKEHSDQMQEIWREWTERYAFPRCTVSKCVKTARHYRRGRREQKKMNDDDTEQDGTFTFYRSYFDRVHNFVAHLYDTGLRVDTKKLLEDQEDSKMEEIVDGLTVDKSFAAERDCIKMKRDECQMDMDRMNDESNKFTIQAATAKSKITFTDALFRKLSETEDVTKQEMNRLKEYLQNNHHDSDSVFADLDVVNDSNIGNEIENEKMIQIMIAFIRSIKLKQNSFSTGYIFEYESKDKATFVQPKHPNLRDEIIESGHLELSDWMKLVLLKAKKYMKSAKVKNMNGIMIEHIIAIILYCDFGKLCTAFSATFRQLNVFEEFESVKLRHSEFANFGKLLVEAVLKFGVNGDNGEKGPFFCGINTNLNIGYYAIRLMGPCSTSTARSVALNFAKSNGVILTLNNDGWAGGFQKCFDCSWMSNYFEEAERLWIAGEYPLRIVTIVIVKNAKNFKRMVHALYVFDAMLSGFICNAIEKKITDADIELISALMDLRMKRDDGAYGKYDSFVIDEWDLFLANKEEIKLDTHSLMFHFKAMSKLVMYNIGYYNGGNDNLVKPEWLWMFPSLRRIRITAFEGMEFGLDALLETVKAAPNSVEFVVQSRYGEWVKEAVTDDLSAAYNESGWSLVYNEEFGWTDLVDQRQKGALFIKRVAP